MLGGKESTFVELCEAFWALTRGEAHSKDDKSGHGIISIVEWGVGFTLGLIFS